MILPALTEAVSPFFRPIKYSLFPPLGLATLAAYLGGAYVVLGGLHVTSLPGEAAAHADTIFLGPGEDTWPQFLADLRSGRPLARYQSRVRTLAALPPIRRDLIKRSHYLVPNSIVVSRGCPHSCSFCYKEAFFAGGRGFYTQRVDQALAEIERLPGRHLYFLDDHLFGDVRFASALFEAMRGMGRLWQAAGTVASVLRPGLLEKAVACGLRSLFVGFETLDAENLRAQRKPQNLRRDYGEAIRRLHGLGVMVNGSFVFGMDATSSSGPRASAPKPWRRATGARTAISTDGATSRAGRRPSRRWRVRCATPPTRRDGRSSSPCGTGSFARAVWAVRCPYWKRCSRGSRARGGGPRDQTSARKTSFDTNTPT